VWSDYVVGVAVMLRELGHKVPAANLLVHGEVPIGAGLSSSAAIEVASALALISFNGAELSLPEVAKLGQRTENVFIGARVGIMDQFVSCLGKAGHALLLDCRSLDYQLISVPRDIRLVICNTMVKHQHAGGAYNQRRAECDEGVKLLKRWYPAIRALRVQKGAGYLSRGEVNRFGELMRESHRSLRDLFEVSCRELDTMAEIAESLDGYCGGRMTGGGFGGCTVNLVKGESAQQFAAQIAERYQSAIGIKPDIYICDAADGAGES
jgi:galactokinase